MTIGIAASGPNAGLAVFRALAALEKVATGAIGGFCAYAAIDVDSGRLHRAETQRGGTATLFVDGEITGVKPPEAVCRATAAGLMSSGPDRPDPLSQFVPAEAGAGLVTGHRLPNAVGVEGKPVNLAVLERLKEGQGAREAVDAVLEKDPEADAGLIVVDRTGAVYAKNSVRVSRRPDLGQARREDSDTGAVVEVIHNAIFPVGSVAALAADIALSVMAPRPIDGDFEIRSGTAVVHGGENRVVIEKGVAVRVETGDRRIVTGSHNCAAVYLGSAVTEGGRILGRTVFEPNVLVEDGRIVTMSGQTAMRIGYRKSSR